MLLIKRILYSSIAIGWIGAPFILTDVLINRDILIPSDIRIGVTVVWYAIPLLYIAWRDRNKPNYRSSRRGPSYRKDTDDWMRP